MSNAKFIIRNDDVAFDTNVKELRKFCLICDKYGYKILHAITPIGEVKKIKSKKLSNAQIKALSSREFSENTNVVEYLKRRNDLLGIHGLWHTHSPSLDEIKTAKKKLEELGLKPIYFIPPFNEGDYVEEFAGLKCSILSAEKGERLEDYLEGGLPAAPVMYLHS